MSNSFAVTDLVAKEVLRVAHEKLAFIGTVDRQYDASFKMNGASPHGATLRVKSPNMYKRRQGSRVMDVQDQSEVTQTITVATQDGCDMRFNSAELMQSVANDGAFDELSRNYIVPAVSALVSGIESDFIAFCTKATASVAGTAGTAVTDQAPLLAAKARLNQQLAPKDGMRYVQADSVTMASLVNGGKLIVNPSGAIGEQYKEGLVSRSSGFDWYENDRMWTMTNAADVAGELNLGSGVELVSGVSVMAVDGFSAAPTAGMVFEIEGTYDVHPETKGAYAHLKRFTVVSATTTSITFSPACRYSTTDPRQNCSGAPTDNDDITFVGSANAAYVQSLAYHKDAFQFVTGSLPIMDDANKCVVKTQDGLSIRVWQGSDIRNDELLMRMDILYGMAALRQEWACRVIGAAN